ncbi:MULTISPECIES: CheR family methyltransferase [Virgibacillus]|nr:MULTISPECIES: protein-glutamate O-methyltransferase CheR [Virgibacillus]MYL41976.1 chemotaxis protein CheR [Virgibacillus massiliensis]
MEKDYHLFKENIKRKLDIDLELYKESQMKRRLTSLRNKYGYASFAEYYEALCRNQDLMRQFLDRMTINVSEFYRNPKRWEVLQEKILPSLVNKQSFTIWSAACSTGEEPYSIAMLLATHYPNATYQILATDIDETVLDKAKQAIYQKAALKDLPEAFLSNYFTEQNDLFYLDQTIKKKVSFKKHNLLADKYPNNVDLVICRNVLIYFTDQAKESIYHKFSNTLTESGVLFVGSTEQIFNPEKYNLKLKETFFYQKDLSKLLSHR